MIARFWMALVVGAWGCAVDVGEYAGRACDADHPCTDSRICNLATQRCVDPSADGGTTGCVRWRQSEAGFDSQQVCPGCSLAIDAANGKALTASTVSAMDGSDFSYGVASAPLSAISSSEGRLQGVLHVPSSARVDDRSAFLKLTNAAGLTVIALSFSDSHWSLGAETSAGVLQPAALSSTSQEHFSPGSDLSFDIVWKRGVERVVRVNGTTVFSDTLSTVSGSESALGALSLGIISYEGSSNEGWTNDLRSWALCDDAEGTF